MVVFVLYLQQDGSAIFAEECEPSRREFNLRAV
jgi:hypothetical protein